MFATTLIAASAMRGYALATAVQARPSFRVLLVGLGPYNDAKTGFPELNGPEDVKRMQAALKRYWGLTDANFHIVVGKEGTKQRILDEFRSWLVKDAKPNDTLVFMFSGHGTLVPDATKNLGVTSAIVPIDIRRVGDRSSDIVKESVISSTEFRTELLKLKSAGVRNITLIFDSCHSGGIARGTARAKGGINPAATRAMIRGRGDQAPAMDDDLGELPGVVIFGAARSDQQAWEGHDGGNLTVAMIEALHQRAGEQGKTGQGTQISMTYRDWFDRVQARMATLPQSLPQEPQLIAARQDESREAFGSKVIIPEPSFLTFAEGNSPQEMTLRMRAGAVFGLKAGMTVSIFPRGTTTFAGATPLATAQIENAGDFVSDLKLLGNALQKYGKKLTDLNGCPAIIQDNTPDATVTVGLAPSIPSGIRAELFGNSKLFRPAGTGRADIVIVPPGQPRKDDPFPQDPSGYMVYGQSGNALAPPIAPVGEPKDLALGLSQPLKDWARRQAVLNLQPSTEPSVRVEMEIVPAQTRKIAGRPVGKDREVTGIEPKSLKSQPMDSSQYFAIRVRATLPNGLPAAGDPTLMMDFSRFIAVLDILPNGQVSQLWPDTTRQIVQDNVRLACDGKWYYVGLSNTLVKESDASKITPWFVDPKTGLGQEVFKLMATSTFQNFTPLLTRSRARDASPPDRLGEIMKSFSLGEPLSRAGNGGDDPKPGNWSVAEITLIVTEKKEGSNP